MWKFDSRLPRLTKCLTFASKMQKEIMTQSYYPFVSSSLGLFIWKICHFSVQGSSISILHTDSNFWNGSWVRRSEGFGALWSQDPYTLLSEFIFLDVFAPQCGFKKRWSSSSFWDPRQSPGDLGGFPGNGSVLEGIGEATSRLMNLRTRDKHVGDRVRFERQRPSGVVQLLCESEDE